jgi:hypothetical protein
VNDLEMGMVVFAGLLMLAALVLLIGGGIWALTGTKRKRKP